MATRKHFYVGLHVCLLNFLAFHENRAVYEIMWKNNVETGRPQMTIWRMRIACWITKATHTHSENVTVTAFSMATMVMRTRLNVNVARYIACLDITNRYVSTHSMCCTTAISD